MGSGDRLRILAVTNMYPNPSRPTSGVFVEQQVSGLRKIGVEVDVLFVDREKIGMRAYANLAGRIRSHLATFDADVVHAMYGGVMADVTTRAVRDRPTVVTFHGSDLLGENLSGLRRKWIAKYGVSRSRQAALRASGIVVVAKHLMNQLPARVNRSDVRLIPCGIDLTRFRPLNPQTCRARLGWPEGRFHVLFNAGNPVKRPALARAAVEALTRMGVPAEMHELRGVSNDEVSLWLNGSDALLLTSLHEGSPTIVKEALACNLPVVSVDVGDVAERIAQIEGCYLAAATAQDLAAKLRLVREAEDRIEAHSTMGQLSVERIAMRLRQFYGEILSAREPQTRKFGHGVVPR